MDKGKIGVVLLTGLATLLVGGIIGYILALNFGATPTTPTTTPTTTSQSSGITINKIGVTLLEKEIDAYSSPLKVYGMANVFEGTVNLRIKDSTGKVIGEGIGTGCVGDDPCPFVAEVKYSPHEKGTVGKLEAFTTSAATGAEEELVTAVVNFR